MRELKTVGDHIKALSEFPEDWPAIKALAERLQRKRAKKLAPPRAG